MNYQELIGQERRFTAEPYHHGTLRIERAFRVDERRSQVIGTVVEGAEVSRLFSETSTRSIAGREMSLTFYNTDLADPNRTLRYIYPV